MESVTGIFAFSYIVSPRRATYERREGLARESWLQAWRADICSVAGRDFSLYTQPLVQVPAA